MKYFLAKFVSALACDKTIFLNCDFIVLHFELSIMSFEFFAAMVKFLRNEAGGIFYFLRCAIYSFFLVSKAVVAGRWLICMLK